MQLTVVHFAASTRDVNVLQWDIDQPKAAAIHRQKQPTTSSHAKLGESIRLSTSLPGKVPSDVT
ncbi:hypothetical protein Hypma_006805 [Hypsizygus marmoreus]|uniref:Uncharacterized protein n=1 Tax=Hypsizygus marmoreus TaxID=39966 RepID=A0A369JWN1_HYPMA|nr:hypothetical protein Hypma_006805 [Hypsizygus marmoreus]